VPLLPVFQRTKTRLSKDAEKRKAREKRVEVHLEMLASRGKKKKGKVDTTKMLLRPEKGEPIPIGKKGETNCPFHRREESTTTGRIRAVTGEEKPWNSSKQERRKKNTLLEKRKGKRKNVHEERRKFLSSRQEEKLSTISRRGRGGKKTKTFLTYGMGKIIHPQTTHQKTKGGKGKRPFINYGESRQGYGE